MNLVPINSPYNPNKNSVHGRLKLWYVQQTEVLNAHTSTFN